MSAGSSSRRHDGAQRSTSRRGCALAREEGGIRERRRQAREGGGLGPRGGAGSSGAADIKAGGASTSSAPQSRVGVDGAAVRRRTQSAFVSAVLPPLALQEQANGLLDASLASIRGLGGIDVFHVIALKAVGQAVEEPTRRPIGIKC